MSGKNLAKPTNLSDEPEVAQSPEIFFFPKASNSLSEPAFHFVSDYRQAVDYFLFTVQLAHTVDHNVLTATKALIGCETDKSKKKRLRATIDNPYRATGRLAEFSELNSRNITNNIIDSFLWYLSEIIQSAMKKRPEILKSSEIIKVEDIFEFGNRRELLNHLVERKITNLSFGGITKLEEYCEKRLGIVLFQTEDHRNEMRVFIEVRNINAHNRGKASRLFLERVKETKEHNFVLGKKVHFDYDKLLRISRACVETVINVDKQITSKFGIRKKQLSTWNAKPTEK